VDIRLPRLGEGADSGSVVNIFVSVGDRIQKDQDILELENEKAVAPIPSSVAGKVTRIHVKIGDRVSAGQVLISVEEEAAKGAVKAKQPVQAAVFQPAVGTGSGVVSYESKSGYPPPTAPSIRKKAGELGIDLGRVRGSARGGRITIQDLRNYVQRLQAGVQTGAAKPPKTPAHGAWDVDYAKWGPVTRKPLTPIRRAIGRKMSESWLTIPHVTQYAHADVTGLMGLIKKHEPLFAKRGVHLTLTSVILQAVSRVLKKHPVVNSSLDEAAGQIVYKRYYHIGVAVDTKNGLIVPVVRDVDKKTLFAISRELGQLAERTRKRKIAAEELKGSTFTISNLGGIGGEHFAPIINPPEVAVLGIARGGPSPVVRKGKVTVRTLLPLSLSYDHRVIDGADGARFIVDLVRELEGIKEKEFKQ